MEVPSTVRAITKGMSAAEVKAILGEPTDSVIGGKGPTARRSKCYRWGRYEAAFWDDALVYLMNAGESGEEHDFLIGGDP